jgi:hypothetical protein
LEPNSSPPLSKSEKKGLPRIEHRLPALWIGRQAEGSSGAECFESAWSGGAQPALLPLRGLQAGDSKRQTPAAQEIIALGGTVDPFRESAGELIKKMSALRVSESTVQRITESVGAEIGEAQARGELFGESKPWDWHKDAEGKSVAYVSVDATGVGIQGPKGAKAEGRMVNVGMIYNPIPDEKDRWAQPEQTRRPPWQSRYVTSLNGMEGLATPLRQQGAQVSMNAAERWVAISDGEVVWRIF